MPDFDGKGPRKTGRGGGLGGGRGSGRPGARTGGACVCPSCGHKEAHERGVPCNTKKCPKCGAPMIRD